MNKLLKIENPELKYKGYICIDTVNNGLAFGGCRFSPDVTATEVSELAACMTLKLLPHGLPVGGAKGGLAADPTQSSIFDIVADFAKKAQAELSQTVVLGKDLGATDPIMDHLYSSISSPQLNPVKIKNPSKRVPDQLRAMTGYQKHMTGKGVAWAGHAYWGDKIKGKKVIIQGAGAVGVGSAFRFLELGAEVVGINDKHTMVYNAAGIPMEAMLNFTQSGVIDVSKVPIGYKIDSSPNLYGMPADILVLAASSSSVRDEHARIIQSELVVEGSNFGLLPSARSLLYKRNIFVIPDIIANSSSAAMVAHQMSTANSLSDHQLWTRIHTAIDSTSKRIKSISKSDKIEPREAFMSVLKPELIKSLTAKKAA